MNYPFNSNLGLGLYSFSGLLATSKMLVVSKYDKKVQTMHLSFEESQEVNENKSENSPKSEPKLMLIIKLYSMNRVIGINIEDIVEVKLENSLILIVYVDGIVKRSIDLDLDGFHDLNFTWPEANKKI